MKPRITVTVDRSDNGEPVAVEIYVNPAGRDHLMEQLAALDSSHEHFHMFSRAWGSDELGQNAYDPQKPVVHHLKVLFRLDEWDQEFFPHVMKDQE
jgi:hypothetical protein